MRLALGVLLIFGFFGFGKKQADTSGGQTVSPGIGLRVGQQAPNFASRDQFGHPASNDTLRGTNGTILLFFRSADW
ncbi:MAG: hypothetical protein WAU89_22670 [Candidatus Acidiferrales bacterium]